MASYSAAKSVHKTLTGTTQDEVTIDGGDVHGGWNSVTVINRSPVGSAALWVRASWGSEPDDISDTDDTEYVPAGGFVNIREDTGGNPIYVKVLGDGNDYSVIGEP